MIELEQVKLQWVVPEKIHTPPTEEISAVWRGRGEKLFLIIVNVLGHPKGVGGLTSYFLRGGGMDVFWNDPMCLSLPYFVILSCLKPEFVLVKGKVLDLVFERVNQSICMSTYLWLIVSLDH